MDLEQDYQLGIVVNVLEKPRILCLVTNPSNYEWVERLPGTHKFIRSIGQVDPMEWDAVITDQSVTVVPGEPWLSGAHWRDYAEHIFPDHMMIFFVFPVADWFSVEKILNIGPSITPEDGGSSDIQLEGSVAGREVRVVSNLPELIKDIIKTSLIPVVNLRHSQVGFIRTGDQTLAKSGLKAFHPFLVGPQNCILAGSFEKLSGSSVWVVPNDLPNISEWFDLALSEWHSINAKNFPGIGAWQTSLAWFTKEERAIEKEILRTQKELADSEREFHLKLDQYYAARQGISDQASLGRKRLLWAQDSALQEAVLEALSDIGFEVEDMDPKWADREFREDYRVRDPDDEDWMVIADATGVTTGAKGSKIASVIGYVTKYVIEESPKTAPGIWILVNHLIERDPDSRGELYRGDDIGVLISQSGLAISTSGLFVLVEAVSGNETNSRALRAWLRSSFGQITLDMARAWLVENAIETSEHL
jgi:hypothetical protein